MRQWVRRLMNRRFDNWLVRWLGFSWNQALDAISRGVDFRPALLLTSRGAKSGLPRSAVLPYFRIGDELVVIASNAGAEKNPAWLANVTADPNVTLHVGRRRKQAVARIAGPEERDRLFAEACRRDRIYNEYQSRTQRRIPVVLLRCP